MPRAADERDSDQHGRPDQKDRRLPELSRRRRRGERWGRVRGHVRALVNGGGGGGAAHPHRNSPLVVADLLHSVKPD